MRPYFRYNVHELIAEYENSADDLDTLHQLLVELERRSTDGARTLKARVADRILEIMSKRKDGEAPIADAPRQLVRNMCHLSCGETIGCIYRL